MQEQVERQRIRERTRQGRQEQAEQYLEGKAADLLGQAHGRAHYQVASFFPFPAPSRPVRPSGSSRLRAPSPPPYNSDLLKFGRLMDIEGHNNAFRTRVRRLFRDTLGVPPRRAQMCGEVAELAVDYVTIGACLSLATSGNPSAIGAPYAAIALHERIIRGVGFPIYCIASKLDNVLYKLHQMMQQWKADREDR